MSRRLIVLLLVIAGMSPLFAKTWHVSITATGDTSGDDWSNTCVLQYALENATSGDEVWVKTGGVTDYLPEADAADNHTPADNRDKTFLLRDGVGLYGGFDGTENSRDERDFKNNKTTLSGDIGTGGDNSDNCYTVVTGSDNAVIDGFTITLGYGDGGALPQFTGGGMYCSDTSPVIRNCAFVGNYADWGGAVFTYAPSGTCEPEFINCVFQNNTAPSNTGGAIESEGNAFPRFRNCVFTGNSAFTGGAVRFSSSSDSALLVNCTFYNNSATSNGGAIQTTVDITVKNCILYGNSAPSDPEIYCSSGTPVFSYCNIFGSGGSDSWNWTSSWDGGGNIDEDPEMSDNSDPDGSDDTWMTLDDGLRLDHGSPCENSGVNDGDTPSEDIRGLDRPYNGGIDMGAYELREKIYYVKKSGSNSNSGLSWGNSFFTVEKGLDKGEEAADTLTYDQVVVVVARGTYYPTEDVTGTSNGRFNTFRLRTGIMFIGGFAGNETNDVELEDRDLVKNETVLSGDLDKDGTFANNAYHVITGEDGTYVDGFTVRDGDASAASSTQFGGGMFADSNVRVMLSSCRFTNNKAMWGGAIIYYGANGQVQLYNCTFDKNIATQGAGAVYFWSCNNSMIMNCVFADNQAQSNVAGAVYNDTSNGIRYVNCTFSGNNTALSAGGMYNFFSDAVIKNCIIYGNTDTGGFPTTIQNSSSTPTISYSDIEESSIDKDGDSDSWDDNLGVDGGGNIDTDPLFVDDTSPEGGDDILGTGDDGFRLWAGGGGGTPPCIDTGSLLSDPDVPPRDILNKIRTGGNADMGAYEGGYNRIIYIDKSNTSGSEDGLTWATAWDDLQDVLPASAYYDVWVAKGTYYTGIVPTDYFHLSSNVGLYGGFNGTETILSQRNFRKNRTILSGDIGNPGDYSDNSYHVVYADSITGAIVSGFTITGGNAVGAWPQNIGGGIFSRNTDTKIWNCIISDNLGNWGGGFGCDGTASPAFVNCVFANNEAITGEGGAAELEGTNPVNFTNCVFTKNVSTTGVGGAICFLVNGGSVTNCTFFDNSAPAGNGGAIAQYNDITVVNSILWGNSAAVGPEIYNGGGTPVFSYSNIAGSGGAAWNWDLDWDGDGGGTNLDENPMFVNSGDPDGPDNTFATGDDGLQLSPGSPCLAAGANCGPLKDILGKIRPFDKNERPDGPVTMGAYEWAYTPPEDEDEPTPYFGTDAGCGYSPKAGSVPGFFVLLISGVLLIMSMRKRFILSLFIVLGLVISAQVLTAQEDGDTEDAPLLFEPDDEAEPDDEKKPDDEEKPDDEKKPDDEITEDITEKQPEPEPEPEPVFSGGIKQGFAFGLNVGMYAAMSADKQDYSGALGFGGVVEYGMGSQLIQVSLDMYSPDNEEVEDVSTRVSLLRGLYIRNSGNFFYGGGVGFATDSYSYEDVSDKNSVMLIEGVAWYALGQHRIKGEYMVPSGSENVGGIFSLGYEFVF